MEASLLEQTDLKIKIETAIAGAIILVVVMPKDFKANNSEFEDSFP